MEKQTVFTERPSDNLQELRPNDPPKELTEEHFLKDLYIFMRKRDTPIERIPHLGFKQIDLFVMFKTVNDLGGYQQVTSQQLWKQVYNTLGGNPRSTSAATCTRRHYEKLLLPYECYVKGIVMSVIPQHQMKPLHYITYDKNDDCGPRPAKRKILSLPLHQNHLSLQSDPHRRFPLPLHYPHFFPPNHTILPPFVPIPPAVMPPHGPPVPKPQFPILPPSQTSTKPERSTEPLEHLRNLSEWYKTSSGLVQQPLNLSKKASPQEITSRPASSFSPPSTSKNPKFLNKPSTLYTTPHTGAPRNKGSDTQEGESSEGILNYPLKAIDSDAADVTVARDSRSPANGVTSGSDDDIVEVSQKPSSPNDFTFRPKEDKGANEDFKGLTLSQIPPGPKKGDMEIEIPLSVFQNWLKLYRSSNMAHKIKEFPLAALEDHTGQRRWIDTDAVNTSLSFQLNTKNSDEDTRLTNAPSSTPVTQGTSNHSTGHSHQPDYSASSSVGISKRPDSRDMHPFDLTDINKPFSPRSQNVWDGHDKESQAASALVKRDSGSPTTTQDAVSKSYKDDVLLGGRQILDSNFLLQLTTEEVMKLKKMLASSS